MATTPPATYAPPARASRYLMFHGREILRGTGFLQGTKITCPDSHVVKPDSVILGDGVLFCDHRPQRHHAQCCALIYLLTIPARGIASQRFWLADCTRAELKEIQALRLDADGILAYFGASFRR